MISVDLEEDGTEMCIRAHFSRFLWIGMQFIGKSYAFGNGYVFLFLIM